MSTKTKKHKIVTVMQSLASSQPLENVVDTVDENYTETNLVTLETTAYYHMDSKSHIDCVLLHVKKKTNEKYKHSAKKDGTNKRESTYYRFMVLGDKNGNSLCLVVENDSAKSHVLNMFDKMVIGNLVKIVVPKFKGYFNQMPVLTCDLLLPLRSKPNFRKQLITKGLLGEDCNIARIITSDFVVKQIGIAAGCCKGLCDSRFKNDCYCKNNQQLTGSVLSFCIALRDHPNLHIKHFTSHKLTKMFVSEEVISKNFEWDEESCLVEIEKHITSNLDNISVTLLLWCKPHKYEESDAFEISTANVTDFVINNNANIVPWKKERVQNQQNNRLQNQRNNKRNTQQGTLVQNLTEAV